jgi:hypothetical protein
MNGGTISPGDPATQVYSAGLNFSSGTYDWQLAPTLKDNGSGTPGVDFDRVQVNGGNLSMGLGAAVNVNLGLLSAANTPGGAIQNTFWNSSHIWTILQVGGTASTLGTRNFNTVQNGKYSTGIFATELDADGNSLDLVYNEFNLASGSAKNPLLGTITLTGGPIPTGSASAGSATSGSFDITGLSPSNLSPISVVLDVTGATASISQWFSQMRGIQTSGTIGYSVSQVGPGSGTVPSWANVPTGDEGFLFTFTNVPGSGDRFLNFDWSAGNGGVALDQVFVAPEPSVMGFLTFGFAAMLKRRRRRAGPHRM